MEASFLTHSQPTPRLTLSLVCSPGLHHHSSGDNMKSPKTKVVVSLLPVSATHCALGVMWAQ